nr:alpha-amylase [Lachnospiraceae bacterium]
EGNLTFSWGSHRLPRLAYADKILYKLHVRGFTMTAPGVRHRGTYLGLLEKKKYLLELGVNAVLLLPCEEFDEIIRPVGGPYGSPELAVQNKEKEQEEPGERKVNYWGFAEESCHFVPKASYASDPAHAGREFKQLVKGMHMSGIEVLLEMNFRPSDNPNLILDCLIWWVREYHVDGFRINCGQTPVRMLLQHPELAGTTLLVPSAGDAAGRYSGADMRLPAGGAARSKAVLAEYNDGFLNEIRRFVKGDEEMVGRVAARLERQTGDIGIINYITDNNGFTLRDLYSYDVKHNEANGEDGRDGSDYNFSWNCGVEGVTKKKKIVRLRAQMQRNALALLLLAQGTPMLLAGDEFGNSQGGNNNAYCQDNETGWVSWKELRANRELFEFVRTLIAFRREHPVLHNPIPLKGMDYLSCGCPDVSRHGTRAWYPDYSNYSRTLALLFCGCYAKKAQAVSDASFYVAANMHWEPHAFDLPDINSGEQLAFLICTDPDGIAPEPAESARTGEAGDAEQGNGNEPRSFVVPPRSIALFIGEKRKLPEPKAARGRAKKPGVGGKTEKEKKPDVLKNDLGGVDE